jgi:hypothetical protein
MVASIANESFVSMDKGGVVPDHCQAGGVPPIHPLYTPYTSPIFPLHAPHTPPICPLYTPIYPLYPLTTHFIPPMHPYIPTIFRIRTPPTFNRSTQSRASG